MPSDEEDVLSHPMRKTNKYWCLIEKPGRNRTTQLGDVTDDPEPYQVSYFAFREFYMLYNEREIRDVPPRPRSATYDHDPEPYQGFSLSIYNARSLETPSLTQGNPI